MNSVLYLEMKRAGQFEYQNHEQRRGPPHLVWVPERVCSTQVGLSLPMVPLLPINKDLKYQLYQTTIDPEKCSKRHIQMQSQCIILTQIIMSVVKMYQIVTCKHHPKINIIFGQTIAADNS